MGMRGTVFGLPFHQQVPVPHVMTAPSTALAAKSPSGQVHRVVDLVDLTPAEIRRLPTAESRPLHTHRVRPRGGGARTRPGRRTRSSHSPSPAGRRCHTSQSACGDEVVDARAARLLRLGVGDDAGELGVLSEAPEVGVLPVRGLRSSAGRGKRRGQSAQDHVPGEVGLGDKGALVGDSGCRVSSGSTKEHSVGAANALDGGARQRLRVDDSPTVSVSRFL